MQRDKLEESASADEVSFQNSFYTSLPAKTRTKEINFSALNLPQLNGNIFIFADQIFSNSRAQEQDTPSYNHLDSSPKTRRTRSLDEIISLLQNENENISQMETHITQQTKLVNSVFEEILERIHSCIKTHQGRLLQDLEMSLQNFKQNYQELKSKYDEFVQSELNATGKRIQLENTQELYNILSRVYEDDNILNSTSNDTLIKLDLLTKIKNRIGLAVEKFPIVKGIESITSYEINKSLTSAIETSLKKELFFENFVEVIPHEELESTARIRGPLSEEYLSTLKRAYKPLNSDSLDICFKYDASKNEFQPKEIARNIKYYDQSLTLIRTECDRIFGYYTDKLKSFAIDFDERQAKFAGSFADYIKNIEMKKVVNLDLANCIKLKSDCNQHKNNTANFGENLIYFKVKELAIFEVTGTLETHSPRPLKSHGVNTLKLEKKFGLIHNLIKQKMNL